MGLFSFLRNAGHKADDDKPEQKPTVTPEQYKAAVEKRREAGFRDLLAKNGFAYQGLALEINDDTIVLTGQVPSEEVREKIVLVVGNVQGIAQVDDRMTVAASATPMPPPTAQATPAAAGITHASGPASTAQVGAAGSAFYTVEKGDSLSKIAKHFYGNANRYPEIFEANKPMLSDPDKIYPGQVLRIPGASAGAGGARA